MEMRSQHTGEKTVPVLYLDLDGTVRHGKDELGRFVRIACCAASARTTGDTWTDAVRPAGIATRCGADSNAFHGVR